MTIWLVVWNFLKKIPWQVYACAGLLLWTFIVYQYGQHTIEIKVAAEAKEGKKQSELFKGVSASISTSAVVQYKEKLKVIHEKGETLIKQVPIYIGNDLVPLPGEFRLLHDAAVSSTLSVAPFGTYAAPVEVATATTSILNNYEVCHVNAATLESLQEWLRAQRQAYLDRCKHEALHCS